MTRRWGKVSYQGWPGAYSHLVCQKILPHLEPLALPTLAEAITAVQQGQAVCAVIPTENSTAGPVEGAAELIAASGLHIVIRHQQPIHHCLLGLPDATQQNITQVLSHPQALAQCAQDIRKAGFTPVEWPDTAGAALEIAQRGDPQLAALASAQAAEIYGLAILQTEFEDQADNTTVFVVLSAIP